MTPRSLFSVLTFSLLVLASCGAEQAASTQSSSTHSSSTDSSNTESTETPSTMAEQTSTTTSSGSDSSRLGAPSTAVPITATSTTTSPSTTEATVAPSTTEGLPGEPADGGPAAGADLAVVGVRYDAALELLTLPDPTAPVVASAAPLASVDIDAAAEARLVSGSVWWKVFVGGQEAWGEAANLGLLGASDDIFDEVGAELVVLTATTVEEMALRVAATRGGSGPQPTVTFVGEPLAFHGVGGFAVIDLLGFGDDSLKGERLRIDVDLAYDENNENVEFVVLSGVERTPICHQGVTPAGTCG